MKNMNVFNGTSTVDFADLDIIQEVITEDRDRFQRPSSFTLPGPPTPPVELLSPNHRMQDELKMRQNSPSSSQPVLVPRGTAPMVPSSFSQPQQQPSCKTEMSSAHPMRRVSPCSARPGRRSSSPTKGQMGPSSQAQNDTDMLECILEQPRVVVVEEPKERGMRFRYECEGRSAGSILGASSTESKKTLPSIEIQGSIEHVKKATVTVSLVTKDIPHRPHPHCLVGKDCAEGSGICVVSFNPQSDRRHSFANLGIQCVRRKELDASLEKRRSQNIDPFRTGHSKSIEDMDMNVVRLCFQCELEWDDGRKNSLNPVVSNPIYDKKATTTSELKIIRLNYNEGPCTGKTEIYMLCDKVQKDDIEIIFKRGSWEAKGVFAQTDVHRQIAIVFKSPPYQEQDISDKVEVNVHLRRLSDRMDSEPVPFTYLPPNPDPYEVKRKRKTKKDGFAERPCLAAPSPAEAEPSTSQPFCYPQTEDMLPLEDMLALEDMLPSAQPGVSTMGEIHYNTSQDSHVHNQGSEPIDEQAILNQLMDNTFLQVILSDLTASVLPAFDQGLDSNFNFGNTMDGHFTQNFGGFAGQDFAKFSDLQFNQLVNENQTPQTETCQQDSPSHPVQVKTEEEEEENV